MKILAIDPGTKRIGLAACDELGLTIRLLPVLKISSSSQGAELVFQLIRREEFSKVLIGLPLNMDGSEGAAALQVRKFVELLQKKFTISELPEIVFWDERLTSFEAELRLREKGIAKAKAKDFLDSVAAEILLEDYLRQTPS